MQSSISACIGLWRGYTLSSDGKELTIQTEIYKIKFNKIVCMSLRPASHVEQQDTDKEIRQAIHYKLLEYRTTPHSILAENYGTTIEIGPLYLPLRLSGDTKQLRGLEGYHIEGDYFAVTLICDEIIISKL